MTGEDFDHHVRRMNQIMLGVLVTLVLGFGGAIVVVLLDMAGVK